MEYTITAVRLRSVALFGLLTGAVNGALLGLPLAYVAMQVSRVLRPGDGTEAALVIYVAVLVFGTVAGALGAVLSAFLYNRLVSETGWLRVEALNSA